MKNNFALTVHDLSFKKQYPCCKSLCKGERYTRPRCMLHSMSGAATCVINHTSSQNEGSPAASGIVAVATEVVWRITFSATLKPDVIPYRSSSRKSPNPRTADCDKRSSHLLIQATLVLCSGTKLTGGLPKCYHLVDVSLWVVPGDSPSLPSPSADQNTCCCSIASCRLIGRYPRP
jgi:hypothetical protein